jgi:hypothetical protein
MVLAAIVVGAYFFTHRSEARHEVIAARHDHAVALSERIRDQVHRDVRRGLRDLDEISQVDVRFDRDFPFEDGSFAYEPHAEKTKNVHVGAIALGAVLVICGWLLFNRERSRPLAHKVLTTVGLLATGAVLFSFLRSDHEVRHVQSHDVVVKLAPEDVAAVWSTSKPKEAPSAPDIRHAKRPVPRDVDELPPRAGEIPVHSELASAKTAGNEDESATKAENAIADSAEESSDQGASDEATETPAGKAESDDAKDDVAKDNGAKNDSDDPATETEVDDVSDAAPAVSVELEEAKPSEPKIELPEPPAAVEAPESPAAPVVTAARPVRSAEATETTPAAEVAAVEASDSLPDWANKPGKLVDAVYRVSIESGLYADIPECQAALDDRIKATLDDYIDRWMGEGTAELVVLDREYVNQHIKKSEYSEVVNSESVGPMHQIHALLEIDDDDRAEFHERWRRAVVTERVWMAGFGGAVVLALLSTVFGYLKLDLQTGGTHSGRLQLAATLVALIVAAGALLARWAVPF